MNVTIVLFQKYFLSTKKCIKGSTNRSIKVKPNAIFANNKLEIGCLRAKGAVLSILINGVIILRRKPLSVTLVAN